MTTRTFRSPFAAVVAVLLLCLLTVVMTWPLAGRLGHGIPYTDRPLPGGNEMQLLEGDHLQLYYHYWLFHDALFGPTPFFSNPYEFHGDPHFRRFTIQMFPDSLVAAALAPGNTAAGYNLWGLLSTVLAGIVTYALARLYGIGFGGALFAGCLYAFLPYRMGQLCGGHQTGFSFWVYPAAWAAVETGLRARRPALWTSIAAVLLISVSLMDAQVAYYLVVGLGVFLAARTVQQFVGNEDAPSAADGDRAGRPWTAPIAVGAVVLAAAGAVQAFRRLDGQASWVAAAWLAAWALLTGRLWIEAARRGRGMIAAAAVGAVGAAALGWISHSVWVVGAWACVAALVTLRPVSRAEFPAVGRRVSAWLIPAAIGLAIAVAWMLYDLGTAVGETAWRNLRRGEAHLYAPYLWDVLRLNEELERRVWSGVVALIALAAGLVRAAWFPPRAGRDRRFPSLLWLALFLGTFALTFGPRFERICPLYGWAKQWIPFYGKSRTTSRIFAVAGLAWAMLAAWGVDGIVALVRARLARIAPRRVGAATAAAGLVAAAALAALVVELRPPRGLGISLLPGEPSVYASAGPGITLALPIWPGDSSPSSVYQYYATQARTRMVNGYSPIVSADYVEHVFESLYPADLGDWTPEMSRLARDLGVDQVIFHEDRLPARLSPFGSGVPLARFRSNPLLSLVESDGPLHRFEVLDPDAVGVADGSVAAPFASPLAILWQAESIVGNGGARVDLPEAWGARAVEPASHRDDGFLVRTRGVGLPSGRYRGWFRVRAVDPWPTDPDAPVLLTRASIDGVDGVDGDPGILAERMVRARDLAVADGFVEVGLDLDLDQTRGVRWAAAREPGAAVIVDALRVEMLPAGDPRRFEAEQSRYAGASIDDASASGGHAVVAGGRGFPIGGLLAAGPGRPLPAGRWEASFRVRAVAAAEPCRVRLRALDDATGRALTEGETLTLNDEAWTEIRLRFDLAAPGPVTVEIRSEGGGPCATDSIRIDPADGGFAS